MNQNSSYQPTARSQTLQPSQILQQAGQVPTTRCLGTHAYSYSSSRCSAGVWRTGAMVDATHGLCSVEAEDLLPCCRTAFTCAFRNLPSAKPGLVYVRTRDAILMRLGPGQG